MNITTHLTSEIEPAVEADLGLLYFTALWCGPCKVFAPIVEQFKIANPQITVAKVDVDEKRPIADLYNVRSVPTVIVLQKGNEVKRSIGMMNLEALEDLFDTLA